MVYTNPKLILYTLPKQYAWDKTFIAYIETRRDTPLSASLFVAVNYYILLKQFLFI